MEFLEELVLAVVAAAVPVITLFLCKWLKSLYEKNKGKIKNDTVSAVLGQVTDVITSAVTTTGNVYVRELKKNGAFTVEAQKEAFNKTYAAVKEQLTADSAAIIEQTYGDVEVYLTNQIEKFVEELKK